MKNLLCATALALLAGSAYAAETKMKFGCEWQKAENGNYWFRTDPGCSFTGSTGAGGNTVIAAAPAPGNDDSGNEGPGDDSGNEGPGDEGPGDGPGDGGDGPGKPGKDKPGNGYGDDNHDHSGPPGQGGDKPGKPGKKGGKR